VLFKSPPDSSDVFANIIVRELKWDQLWNKEKRTKNQFPFPIDTSKLTPVQDSLVRELYFLVINQYVNVGRQNKNLSVYELSTTSTNPIISCYLTQYLMEETAHFYIDAKTSSARKAVHSLQRETDSLRSLLSGTVTTTASEVDRTFALNPAFQVQRSTIKKGEIKTGVLTAAYSDMVRNLQVAKLNLQNENPLYQVIDTPELPLIEKKKSKLKAIVIGFVLGSFLAGFFLIFIKFFRYIKSLRPQVIQRV
jgi:hypothetical protein